MGGHALRIIVRNGFSPDTVAILAAFPMNLITLKGRAHSNVLSERVAVGPTL